MKKKTNLLLTITLTLAMIMGTIVSADAFVQDSPFSNTDCKQYTHKDKFKNYLMVDGVDVSEYQSASSSWRSAKRGNVDFAILRVAGRGYGSSGNLFLDDNFATFYNNAKDEGVMVGLYVFSQATTVAEAKEEANVLIDKVEGGINPDKYNFTDAKKKDYKKRGMFDGVGAGPADIDLPIYMDYEFSGGKDGRLYGLKEDTAKKCAKAFCETVAARGYKPGIYANTSFFNSELSDNPSKSTKTFDWIEEEREKGIDIDIWCAQYNKENTSPSPYSKWQFSSSANVSGIKNSAGKIGNTDADFWYIKKNPTSTDPSNLASCSVYGRTTWNYTGNIIEPTFDIYNTDGALLKEGVDYKIGYINNVIKGSQQAYAYITGMTYDGYLLIPFTIGSGYMEPLGMDNCDAEVSIVSKKEITTEVADEEVVEPADEEVPEETAEATEEEVVEDVSQETVLENSLEISGGRIIIHADSMTVEELLGNVEIANKEDCEGYSLVVLDNKGAALNNNAGLNTGMLLAVKNEIGAVVGTMDIALDSQSIKNATANNPTRAQISVSLNTTSYYCDGSAKKPSAVVMYGENMVADGITASTSDVKLTYASGRIKPGTYKVTAKGLTYPGTATASFTIKVKPTQISSLIGGSKSFTVTVNQLESKYSTGYQLRYSKYSSMKSAKKVTIGTKYSKVSKKVSKLTKNKTYYVQVRTVRKVSGKKYYSAWSNTQTVKTN